MTNKEKLKISDKVTAYISLQLVEFVKLKSVRLGVRVNISLYDLIKQSGSVQ